MSQYTPSAKKKKKNLRHTHTLLKLLRTGVEGPCLHRPENWLRKQLNDESKPVYKVGFISEKGKATVRELQWSPEASGSLHR
jgi:hypothetical protein